MLLTVRQDTGPGQHSASSGRTKPTTGFIPSGETTGTGQPHHHKFFWKEASTGPSLSCKARVYNVSCKRVQDPRAVFGKRLPRLPEDGTSPSRRSLTFKLEPNMKIIKSPDGHLLQCLPISKGRWLAFLLTLPSHKPAHIDVPWCKDDSRNGAGISHGQASGKMLQNTNFQEVFSSGTTRISLLPQLRQTRKPKRTFSWSENHFWPRLNKFIFKQQESN